MAKASPRIRLTAVVWTALLCAFCSGCIVPVRVPTKSISVSGATGKRIDLGFIKPGVTTREEIAQKLDWIDTGVKDENIYVGRWAESSWGVAWAVAGGYSGSAGWNRAWTIHNLLIDFDEKGVALQTSDLHDKELLKKLSERVSNDPSHPLDLSTPIRASVEYIRSDKHFLGTLILSKEDFRFIEDRETGSKVAYDFKTPPDNVSELSLGTWGSSYTSHPEYMDLTIHFKRRTAVGSKLLARADLPTTMILLKYIRQAQSGSSSK